MKKVLSSSECSYLIEQAESKEWFRVTKHCQYDQTFIQDLPIEKKLEAFFGEDFVERPIIKVLKLGVGDKLPLYSGDYDRVNDNSFSRYIGTNFLIQTYLNSDFEGGRLSLVNETYQPSTGYGIIQRKSQICSISPVISGVAYILFCYIKKLKPKGLL